MHSSADIPWPFVPAARNLNIVGTEGAYLETSDGRRILDAAGGAIVVNVGHGRRSVAEAVAQATEQETYVVPPWLTPSRAALIERLRRDWLPAGLGRVHLACGGSEGVESAMKIALQYHAACGRPERTVIIGRDVSYHGTTLATTAVGGHEARKKGLAHALADYPRVATPYPLRCPLGPHDPGAGDFYVAELEDRINEIGPDSVAAFLAEPIIGSSGGAIVPPENYWPAVRALCDRHGIVLIMDEVMTGFGRTGLRFGHQHWDVTPDILVAGKGLAGGYAPIAGIFARDEIASAIAEAEMNVMFHTFGAHPAACAAANEVLRILTDEDLVARAASLGERLAAALNAEFAQHPHVAEVRGRGLLQAVEIVADRDSLERFPTDANVTNRIVGAALERGVFFYGGGTGSVRDIVCFGPPFIIDDGDIETMVQTLGLALEQVLG
jgi:adenosylmethionine-8-amino-7-oxononanoate aminotransferase